MSRRAAGVALLVAVTALMTGCDRTTEADASVELVEFSISGPQTLTTEDGGLEIANVGEFPHTLVITDADGEVAAATGLILPGETTILELDLEPGQYMFTCRMIAEGSTGELIDHFEAGMHTGVVVEG